MPDLRFNSFGSLDDVLAPRRIRPSAGDIEESRIKQLLDLAHLAQLQQEPALARAQLNLQRQRAAMEALGLTETTTHNRATEMLGEKSLAESIKQAYANDLLQQRGQDIQQRGQDVVQQTSREGEAAAMERSRLQESGGLERTKLAGSNQTTDTILNVLGHTTMPDVDKLNMAKVLALRGSPELLQVLGSQKGSGDAMADATLAYMQSRQKGATPTSKGTVGEWSNKKIALSILAPYLAPFLH